MLQDPLPLSLELEARTNLVCGLIQVLRVKGKPKPEGDAGSHLNVIGEGSNTAVVDFGLSYINLS